MLMVNGWILIKHCSFTLFVVIRSSCSRVYRASILLKEDIIGPRFSNMEKRKERKRDADLCFLASAREQDSERGIPGAAGGRSEEHTSELQSRGHLVCRLL